MPIPRLHCPLRLISGEEIDLPPKAARHVQVLRLQPGDLLELFHGGLPQDPSELQANTVANLQDMGWFEASIIQMGRSTVRVRIGKYCSQAAINGKLRIHIACGMPANDRMDWLVEKATELGVASIQPLLTQRSVLRLSGERADKKQLHWQAIAIAACEQSGRTVVPWVKPVCTLDVFLQQGKALPMQMILSTQADAQPLRSCVAQANTDADVCLLSGPEGGFSPEEEKKAEQNGWQAISLGRYTLRAETAPLAALAILEGL